jgi:hypothetical protein
VKQEVAKEGILPFSLSFAQGYNFSLRWLFGQKQGAETTDVHFHSQETPAATLALHWVMTTLLVLIAVLSIRPEPYTPSPAYYFLVSFYSYIVDILCFTAIGLGMLCLRLMPSVRWAEKSAFRNNLWLGRLSTVAAFVLFITSLFPLIFMWVPDPSVTTQSGSLGLVSWYTAQTLGISVVAFSFIYWVVFRVYIILRSSREGKELQIHRDPIIKDDGDGPTQVYEIVALRWVPNVGITLQDLRDADETVVSSI